MALAELLTADNVRRDMNATLMAPLPRDQIHIYHVFRYPAFVEEVKKVFIRCLIITSSCVYRRGV
jgi:hypothetical protein